VSEAIPRVRSWTRGSEDEVASGLLAYVTFEHAGLVVDGVTLRKMADGRIGFSYPAKIDRAGRKYAYVRPADDDTRQEFERQLLAQLTQVPELRR
jgi:hypothetical protein